jgi:hypothetical protein
MLTFTFSHTLARSFLLIYFSSVYIAGDDDMPGHVKSSLMGVSLNIPIRDGRLALGTWQGIYLCEHRDQGKGARVLYSVGLVGSSNVSLGGWGGGHTRKIIVTIQGQSK